MRKRIFVISVVAVAAIVLTMGISSSAYAVNGYGVSYGPSFGGGKYYSQSNTCVCSYHDGLKINGKSFDVSQSGTTVATQTLYVGAPSKITLKIFSNSGTYAIRGGAIMLNVRGPQPAQSDSDTFVQFDKWGGVMVRDPHNILGNVKVSITYDKNYMYVTFNFTPKSPLSTSDLILEAWDYRLSVGTTSAINVINISYVPGGYHK